MGRHDRRGAQWRCVAHGAPATVITEAALEEIYTVPFAVLAAEGTRVAQVKLSRGAQ